MSIESLSSTSMNELVRACDAFEEAWKAGRCPRIEEYLGTTSEPERTALLQMLLKIEFEMLRKAGSHPQAAEYLAKFATHAKAVRAVFGDVGTDAHAAPPPIPPTEPASDFSPPAQDAPPAPETTIAIPSSEATAAGPTSSANGPMPARIGQYQIQRHLGRGNFDVYLARDEAVGRDVAIKIACRNDAVGRRRLMSLAHEADKLKALNHPRIVKLYEYVPGGDEPGGGDGFIVLEYIEGQTLEDLFHSDPPPAPRLVKIIALIADAVHHAHIHRTGVVHRDLKPANVVVDLKGEPHVCDFGLAVDEEVQRIKRGEVAGTLPYMAPEQVRGETHRLDGRTDIWALGVILYRGLTGRLPFPGVDQAEIFNEILHRDPKPLRMYKPALHPELERICLRCLSRPMGERYLTAADLADDLNRALEESSPRRSAEPDLLLPKGLRPYDCDDATSFLSLLPGPRMGDGMPESVRFWKDRVEAVDGHEAFSVGLLFGPSGGGKSSFVKAGLLPNLDRTKVRSVHLEATPNGTERRLMAEVRPWATPLPAAADLADAIAILRDDPDQQSPKFFLVLDQFEQWLQAHPDEPDAELVRALRQCDGKRVQAILVVRDDFWTAVTRFLRAVDVSLVVGGNAVAVELFDARHARKVLEGFGQALGQLRDGREARTEEAARFLDEAVHGLLGSDDRVIPVRLSLFTEVIRHRPWTPATLEALGGVDGSGVKFLDDCFASVPYKHHRNAAQAVLHRLLPPPTSVIRGIPRAFGELRQAAGYADQPGAFLELMRALDGELKLIVATDSDGSTPGSAERAPSSSEEPGETLYQLAHDYLVRPVRQWVERDQRSTRRGRAQLRLAFITAAWRERPGRRQLPSLLEWGGILSHIRPREWSKDERRLMRATARYYLARVAMVVAMLAALFLVFNNVRDGERAASLLERALKSDARELASLSPDLSAYRNRLRDGLERAEGNASAPPRERAVAAILLHRDRPSTRLAGVLRARARAAGPDEVALIRDALAADPSTAGADALHRTLFDDSEPDGARLRAACLLAGLGPIERDDWARASDTLTRALLDEDRRTIPRWLTLLDQAAPFLLPPLARICADATRDPSVRATSADALAGAFSARGDAAGLAHALSDAQPDAALILLRALEQTTDKEPGVAYLRQLLKESAHTPRDERLVARQALATVALADLGDREPLHVALKHRSDPHLRTHTIQAIATLALAPRVLLDEFAWSDFDGAERQAVLLAWAETRDDGLSPAVQSRVIKAARASYVADSDPGVHSAAELLLRRWGSDALPALGSERGSAVLANERGWEQGPNGHTFVFLPGPVEFLMGSPPDEPKRFEYETRHYRRIDRSLMVATTETTVEQFRAFKPDHQSDERYFGEPSCPVGGVSWYDALRYCNWLSRKAGLDVCYPEKVGPGMVLPSDTLDHNGFRLPTEAEWEYFCRAGADTCRPFGESQEFLNRYAWTWLNSAERSAPAGRLLPNEFGLFDTLGSEWEWTHDGPTGNDWYPAYPYGTRQNPAPDSFAGVPVNNDDWRIVRGGCFDSPPSMARSAHRDIIRASASRYFNGFRVVRTVAARRGSDTSSH
jgi:serine/threonine protein kinase/formylglycine-generating enzyme required for sulfatase activity